MTQNCWILLLVKDPNRGKMRLATGLSPSERSALAWAMATDAVAAVIASAEAERVTVLTDSPEVAQHVTAYGCAVIYDDLTLDLAGNIDKAVVTLCDHGAARVLILGADLPLITPKHIRDVITRTDKDVLIGRADRDGGTTAICVPVNKGYRFFFEQPASALHHAEEAKRLGLSYDYLEGPFKYDIDVTDDYTRLASIILSGDQDCGEATCRVVIKQN